MNELTFYEKIKLLSSNGMLIKRPLLINNEKVIVGYSEEEYKQIINKIR